MQTFHSQQFQLGSAAMPTAPGNSNHRFTAMPTFTDSASLGPDDTAMARQQFQEVSNSISCKGTPRLVCRGFHISSQTEE